MLPEIHIIYASTSGNVEIVCEKVAETLNESRIKTFLYKAEDVPEDVVRDNTFFLLATSTWEHGVINPYFNRILDYIKTANLNKKYAGMIGLGDTRYEPVLFCQGIEELKDAFIASGGRQVATTLKINGNPYKILDTVVRDWTEQFILQIRRYVR